MDAFTVSSKVRDIKPWFMSRLKVNRRGETVSGTKRVTPKAKEAEIATMGFPALSRIVLLVRLMKVVALLTASRVFTLITLRSARLRATPKAFTYCPPTT